VRRYRLFLFDFDGTLVDTLADIAYYANKVMKKYGYPEKTPDKVKKAIGWGVHELFKALAPEFGENEARLEEAVALFRSSYYAEPVRATALMTGVREMLDGPLKKTRKAIITNKPQDITQKILVRLGLEGTFDPVIGMHGDFPQKPDPASTLSVMKRWKTAPEESIFIGDSGVDFETAQKAGVDFVWMTNGYDDSLKDLPLPRKFSSAQEWGTLNLF
jgi:phosphoglycolate phosphatase